MGKKIIDIAPDDIIGAIIAYSGTEKFTSSKRFLHTAFYSFAQQYKEKYPVLFEDFIFSQGDIYPFSHTLESVLISLQVSGIIVAENPKYRIYKMGEKARTIMKKNAEKRLTSYIPTLKDLGEKFAEKSAKVGEEE